MSLRDKRGSLGLCPAGAPPPTPNGLSTVHQLPSVYQNLTPLSRQLHSKLFLLFTQKGW